MRQLVIAVGVVASVLLGDRSAEACKISLSFKITCRPSTEIVPIDPSFVILASTAEELGEHDVVTLDGRPVPFDVVPISETWARLVVSASQGMELLIHGVGSCSSHRVRTASTAWPRRGGPPVVDVDSLSYRDDEVSVGFEADGAAATRVDWALSRSELQAGRHASVIDQNQVFYLATGRDLSTVFVRATPLLLDGSEGVPWDGWIHRDAATETLRVGTGAEPESTIARAPFEHRAPWVVGEAPVLEFELDRESTFVATSSDGATLPAETFECDHGVCVAVTASAGTELVVELLPRGRLAPWRFHVAEGPPLPRFGVARIEAPSVDRLHIHVTGPTALRDGAARITWDDRSADVMVSDGTIVLEVDPAWSTQSLRRFELVPRNGELLGEPCEGWLHRDPETGALTLQEGPAERSTQLESCLVAPAPAIAPRASRSTQVVSRRPQATATGPSDTSPSTTPWWLLAGVAIAVLAIGRVVTSSRHSAT